MVIGQSRRDEQVTGEALDLHFKGHHWDQKVETLMKRYKPELHKPVHTHPLWPQLSDY